MSITCHAQMTKVGFVMRLKGDKRTIQDLMDEPVVSGQRSVEKTHQREGWNKPERTWKRQGRKRKAWEK